MNAESAFAAISYYGTAGQFAKFARKETSLGQFSVSLFSSNQVAMELGRPLDDLHDQAGKREGYLGGLSPEQITGLLLSDPAFFYTSTNHMLFDRLSGICKEKNITVTGLLKSYGIETDSEPGRNIIFRAISYDRLYGTQTSGIFTKEELNEVIPALLNPLKNDGFDKTYFYMLANSLDGISKAGYKQTLIGILKGQSGKGDDAKAKATEFLVDYLEHPEHFDDLKFNRKNYLDASGRLLIVQVFDKKDTESDHWKLTQEWASKYGQPVQGSSGELIYENASAKIVLFMGKDESENQSFIKSTLEKNKDVILTFRGHSYSLEKNFPADIFGNHGGHVLFIPGSCGSASSIPSYISSNPLTKFAFFANSSTGRGQVTNYGILDGLIAAKTPATFRKILDSKRAIIEANDGNAATIQTPDLLGERLMEHIYSER